MKYAVKAMSVDPESGAVLGVPQVEVIDTETNELFAGAADEWDVEDAYSAFWNRIRQDSYYVPAEKVVVLTVERRP